MDFDKRYRNPEQRIAQGNAGMGQGAGVDDDEVDVFVAGGMNAVDQLIFRVALQKLNMMAGILGYLQQARIDVYQSLFAVDFRLPGAKQIEIGAV